MQTSEQMRTQNRGILIAFEGIDGVGLTTHARKLRDLLESRGYKVVYTKEPTESYIGRWVKSLIKGRASLLKGNHPEFDPRVVALAFTLDRALHVRNEIIPRLQQGYIVICDRYALSTYAYQTAQGVSLGELVYLNIRFSKIVPPDLIVLLEAPIETCLKRLLKSREYNEGVFEVREFLQKVKDRFEFLVHENILSTLFGGKTPKVIRINTDRPIDDVSKDILISVSRVLREYRNKNDRVIQLNLEQV